MRAALVALLMLALPLGAAQTCPEGAVVRESALWNAGPALSAGIHSSNSHGGACLVPAVSAMWDGARDGNTPKRCAKLTCAGKPIIDQVAAPDGSCPSFYHVTYGWEGRDFAQYPGWAIWHEPDSFRLFNNAQHAPDACTLREVSITYKHWPAEPSVFAMRKAYVLSEIKEARGVFSAKLNRATKSQCGKTPAAYVTSDFGVVHLDFDGVQLRADTVGVLIYEQARGDDPVYWSNGCKRESPLCQMLLRGRKLGHAPIGDDWQNYDIEFLALLNRLPPPPSGTVRSEVTLWEAYSATRGADVDFSVRGMDLQIFR